MATPVFSTTSTTLNLGLTGSYTALVFADLDGDSDLDAVVGIQTDDGKEVYYIKNNSGSASSLNFDTPTLLFGITSKNPTPALADIDNDGDLDLALGLGYSEDADITVNFYPNTPDGSGNPVFATTGVSPGFTVSPTFSYPGPTFADLNGDGKQDLIVGESTTTIDGYMSVGQYFKNNGNGFDDSVTTDTFGLKFAEGTLTGNTYRPAFADLDGDGDLDAVVGGMYGVWYFENTGTATVPAFATPTQLLDRTQLWGSNTQLTGLSLADLDGDGDLDLVAGGMYGEVFYVSNFAKPKVTNVTASNTDDTY